MQNLKIRVNNERESIEIQKLFFKLGYKWANESQQTLCEKSNIKHLYAYSDKRLQYSYTEKHFQEHESQEVTIQDLKAMVEPKHPKVWAWDDDITEAFQTYMIAEFEGMKDNLNHLVVGDNWVTDFENKHFFETYFRTNISYRNPNTHKEIEAIANRIKDEFKENPDVDWAYISACKIYSSHIKESK